MPMRRGTGPPGTLCQIRTQRQEHVSPHSVSRQIVLASRPHGRPQTHNFRLVYDVMPDLPPGGVLLRVLYLSFDPGVLGRMDERSSNAKPLGIGQVMAGESVSEVIASDCPAYAIGDLVLSSTGWRTHVASDGTGLRKLDSAFAPVTTALGVLGTPGFAAYSGITLIGKGLPRRDRCLFRECRRPHLARGAAALQPIRARARL